MTAAEKPSPLFKGTETLHGCDPFIIYKYYLKALIKIGYNNAGDKKSSKNRNSRHCAD